MRWRRPTCKRERMMIEMDEGAETGEWPRSPT